ncbi:MAG: 30S ribosome-binding factor RbfA [bacterium]|nr:30S ribosome-binding factor RbfA [bacterium]
MPTTLRLKRLSDTFLRETSMLLLTELQDPRLHGVTLTTANLTKDLSLLRFYYVTADPAKKKEALEGLKNAAGYIRRELAKKMALRLVPKLDFFFDETDLLQERTDQLFKEIE